MKTLKILTSSNLKIFSGKHKKLSSQIRYNNDSVFFYLMYNFVYFRKKKVDCQENVPLIVAKRLLKFINLER